MDTTYVGKAFHGMLAYLKEMGEDVSRYSIAVGYGYDYEDVSSQLIPLS